MDTTSVRTTAMARHTHVALVEAQVATAYRLKATANRGAPSL